MQKTDFKTNSTFIQDEKTYRKLRKNLRQIEHLNLLPRPLNEEEKHKVLKRDIFRKQLNELISKYPNNELNFRDPHNNTNEFDNTQTTNNEVSNINSSQIETYEEEEVIEVPVNQLDSTKQDTSFDLDDLTSKMNTLAIEKQNNVITQPLSDLQSTPEVTIKQNEQESIKKTEVKQEQEQKHQQAKSKNKKQAATQPVKPSVCFDTYEIKNAHEDLITTLDICMQHNLIVTGSRDTSIKVWSINNLNKPKLVHSFGGHSGSITLVKFWSNESYVRCLKNLSELNGEPVDYDSSDNDKEIDDENDNVKVNVDYPLIMSSSLDCSIRIWSINKEKCIKNFYLYNPINHFCLNELSFVVGLGAGKIQLWININQAVVLKAFDDTESVCCVKMVEETRKVYALSHTGILKQFEITKSEDDKYSLDLNKTSDIFSLLSESHTVKENFKSFEVLDENKILLINDNQSFLVLFNVDSNSYQFISTNTQSYGFTSCFYKLDNHLLVSAYNIDDESSNINVFDCESMKYSYSLYDSLPSSSLSTLTSSWIKTNSNYLIAGATREAIKLWSTCESVDKSCKSLQKQVKYLKMCKKFNFHLESCNEDDEEESDEEDENIVDNKHQDDNDDDDKNNKNSKSYCSIQ